MRFIILLVVIIHVKGHSVPIYTVFDDSFFQLGIASVVTYEHENSEENILFFLPHVYFTGWKVNDRWFLFLCSNP